MTALGGSPELALAEERQSLGYLGMVVFLGSWAMMFAALFFSYAVLRAQASAWPPLGSAPLPLLLPGVSTMIILASSGTLHWGLKCVREGRPAAFLPWLLVTIAVGAIFLAVQIRVWSSLVEDGLLPSSSSYGSIFYLLTAFHFLHVVVGLGLLCWLLPGAVRRAITPRRRVRVKLISMFWHFVTLVWVAIYLSVYVI